MDVDLNAPAFVTPDVGGANVSAGAVSAPLSITVAVRDDARLRAEDGSSRRSTFEVDGSALPLLPRVRRQIRIGDHQLLAAAELIRRGLARRVLLANAAVDSSVPDDCEVRGVSIHLDRLPDGRTRVTAGRPRT